MPLNLLPARHDVLSGAFLRGVGAGSYYPSGSNTRHVVREGGLDAEVLRSDERHVAQDRSSCRMIVNWPFVKVTF